MQRTGPHDYQGHFDSNRGDSAFLPIGAPSVESAGLSDVLFTATTDEQDRVSLIRLDLPPSSNSSRLIMTTTLSEQGRPLRTKAPAKASVAEADGSYYK